MNSLQEFLKSQGEGLIAEFKKNYPFVLETFDDNNGDKQIEYFKIPSPLLMQEWLEEKIRKSQLEAMKWVLKQIYREGLNYEAVISKAMSEEPIPILDDLVKDIKGHLEQIKQELEDGSTPKEDKQDE